MKMCEAFHKYVGAGKLKKIVSVSSSQGSIASVKSPLLYWYRSRKSALNMQMVHLALQPQKKKVIVGLVTPGATATDFIPEQFRKAIKSIQTPQQVADQLVAPLMLLPRMDMTRHKGARAMGRAIATAA